MWEARRKLDPTARAGMARKGRVARGHEWSWPFTWVGLFGRKLQSVAAAPGGPAVLLLDVGIAERIMLSAVCGAGRKVLL